MQRVTRQLGRPWFTVRRSIALVMVAVATACGGSSDKSTGPTPAPASLSGTWSGPMISGGDVYVLTLTLTSATNVVSGTGTLDLRGKSVALTTAGTLTDAGSFTLSMTPSGAQPIVYVGTVNMPFMKGVASGGGYSDADLVLSKQ